MPSSHIRKWWRNLKPALAIPRQWPSKVMAPRYPSSILAKLPVTLCLDQDFWKRFAFNLWPSSFLGRQAWSVCAALALKGRGYLPTSQCQQRMWHPAAGHKGLFYSQGECQGWELHSASTGRSRVKPRDSALLCYQGCKSHASLDPCRVQAGSGRERWHAVMQESSTASCSHGRMQELPMHQKIPSIQTGVWCNSSSTLILSVATIWGAEGHFCVIRNHGDGNFPPHHCGIQPCRHCPVMDLFTSICWRKLGDLFSWWLSWLLKTCSAT